MIPRGRWVAAAAGGEGRPGGGDPAGGGLRSIESGSKRLSQLATELSKRIAAFEDWLNALPGRIETMVWLPAPDGKGTVTKDFLKLKNAPIGEWWALKKTLR